MHAQVYPGTTTFYRGVVAQPAQRTGPSGEFGEYIVEFEDDDQEGALGRPVEFRHVLHYIP